MFIPPPPPPSFFHSRLNYLRYLFYENTNLRCPPTDHLLPPLQPRLHTSPPPRPRPPTHTLFPGDLFFHENKNARSNHHEKNRSLTEATEAAREVTTIKELRHVHRQQMLAYARGRRDRNPLCVEGYGNISAAGRGGRRTHLLLALVI